MALAQHHHLQHQQQQQHHQQSSTPSQQQQQQQQPQQHHHIDHQRGITITTLPSTTTVAQHQQQQQQQSHIQPSQLGNGSSPHHHFNVAALTDLSSAMQLGAVTADGNFVTMGGVVVGRIQHPRTEDLQHLGVIKVESPTNVVAGTVTVQRDG